ncbi:hypothetical protein YC2023_083614 [Brassica napus]
MKQAPYLSSAQNIKTFVSREDSCDVYLLLAMHYLTYLSSINSRTKLWENNDEILSK